MDCSFRLRVMYCIGMAGRGDLCYVECVSYLLDTSMRFCVMRYCWVQKPMNCMPCLIVLGIRNNLGTLRVVRF